MSRSFGDRLKDIVEAADLAVRHASNLGAIALKTTELPRDAALFRIAIIGEAVSQLPAEVLALAPEIPWSQVTSMRNHIIHGYWQIDFEVVAETLDLDLEPLRTTAIRLIELIERPET
jgi:uncharacterized protein with HEPN domain